MYGGRRTRVPFLLIALPFIVAASASLAQVPSSPWQSPEEAESAARAERLKRHSKPQTQKGLPAVKAQEVQAAPTKDSVAPRAQELRTSPVHAQERAGLKRSAPPMVTVTNPLPPTDARAVVSKLEITPQVAHTGSVRSVAFSPNGRQLLSAGGTTVKLWDTATGALLRTFKGDSGAIYAAVFSPDGSRVASCSDDTTVKLWDAATGALLHTFEEEDSITSVMFSPDGKQLLLGSFGTLTLRDAVTGVLLRTICTEADERRESRFSAS